ncbi:IS21 family transposase [Marinagarivorans cellulosilyticus]|uniref:Integrase catalytic domain-containing protein n=1 Tax=Marinagarivorans cellulosilyticus TaxID=2721545 RepID=A0AAN2BLB5_9GAMM|nr:IS21 family transposase [Marinagarivorans cellulosilyticus]BCD98850.1 hypothetical protein MARGE09_P3051 [Marinagarivorans cellulosilyticus]
MTLTARREALRLLLQTKLSNRKIGELLGVSRNTVARDRKKIQLKQWCWSDIEAMDDIELSGHIHGHRQHDSNKVMPDWPETHKLLQAKHQTRIELWESYRDAHKDNAYSYSQFNHHYKQHVKTLDICMRQIHYAGEVVYVDYAGKTIPYYDDATQSQRQAQVFVGVMGCSNYTFVFASASQKLENWIEAHNRMLWFFGGVPQVVVPDNLKSAVTKPGRDPVINRSYQDWAEHCGLAIVPARVRKPQDKSKAEIGVKLITRWISVPLSRQMFQSVHAINQAIAPLLQRFNQRPFKRLPGSRESHFNELDKTVLRPLPDAPHVYGEWLAEQKVGPDYHVYVQGHAYSVPYHLVGKQVSARISLKSVELFCVHKRVACHLRDDIVGGATTQPEHRPASHHAYANQSLESYTEWALTLGTATASFVAAQFKGRHDHYMPARQACGRVKALARQYDAVRLEAACQRALDIQSPTVKSLTSILRNNLDASSSDDTILNTIPEHSNVRGPDYFLIEEPSETDSVEDSAEGDLPKRGHDDA